MEDNNILQQVIIYGDSDFAEQVYYQLETDGRYKILAFTVDETMLHDKTFKGLPVIPFQQLKKHYSTTEVQVFPAIGYSKLNSIREIVVSEIKQAGYKLLTYISKLAFIGANTQIGEGCFICEFVSIGIHSELGKAIVILPNSRIGHNNNIGDFCYFSNSISTGGRVTFRKNSFIGLHATIRNSITIEECNVIGTASNVVKSTDPYGIYVGNPAKRLKDVDLKNISF
jgi:sugar O-acyltransferase (sialic acid O-acetyltransferase NeuD family)